jgi:hypothetical protein
MQAISELKEQAVTDTPLIVFDCILASGRAEHWSTHGATASGVEYEARVIQHSAFDIQTASDQGVDGSPLISIVLANADSHFSEIERTIGWKGARLTVSFLFYDLRSNVPLTDATVVFQGICNPPERSDESSFRLSAVNRMSLQRVLLPQVRIQRRCPWEFPITADQRSEAVSGGANGKYSLYYRCGYSAGIEGGTGNLNGSQPFTSCGYTRSDCQTRGMFGRFGGLEFVPSAIAVRGYGKDWSTSAVSVNQARYNDYIPMVYGTVWHSPTAVFARNDGNLTRMEVLLGIGEIQGVLTVLVNGVEIPQGVKGTNMTGTGWYNVETLGTRDGCFDNNFVDGNGTPQGDPYGSLAYLSVVVPNRLSSGTSLPSVSVLLQGLKVPVYGLDGGFLAEQFSSNPSWILLDLLRRSGWAPSEIDIASFANTAAFCDEKIAVTDPNGNTITLPRFECNLLLQRRRSAGDVVRGVRNCARLYITYGPGGTLQAHVENTLALESPIEKDHSNSTETLNGGWPSYEFGDGSNGFSGILRRPNGSASVTLTSRSIADTPNRMSVEFQDALNGYQQDSFEMLDSNDVALTGQLTSSTLMALGLPHYDQAARILKFNLDKSLRGNTYIEFQTSVKAFGIAPGDLISITYLKEGYLRQPFRVLKLSPATNYRTSTITAQIHYDAWYSDTNGQVTSPSGVVMQDNSSVGLPKPLQGSVLDDEGNIQFGVEETAATNGDGSIDTGVRVSFIPPPTVPVGGPGIPLLSISAEVGGGGILKGGRNLYYAVSARDSAGRESALSFLVRASIPNDASSVTLAELSFAKGTDAFHVYRGDTPAQLFRIASDQPVASSFIDDGLDNQLTPPPDSNFDHANFYWRRELQPEVVVTIHSPTSIGSTTLQMTLNANRGVTVRITRGTGAGQERFIVTNDANSLTVAPWDVEPDASSFFAIAEAGWHFGALTKSSPVQFSIPNRAGEVVQIMGRAANVNDTECSPEISTVTRWMIGGAGTVDADVPPAPFFGLAPGIGDGKVVLSGVSFADLTNTRSISSGTLTLLYWNELLGTPATLLAEDLAVSDTTLTLNVPGPADGGSLLQIDAELLQVLTVGANGTQYELKRGANGSISVAHTASAPVYHLLSQTTILPFPSGFFGTSYSGSWSYPVSLPDVRVSSAELFVTNQKGNSAITTVCMTHNNENGLRTLSGGQYSIQADGFLAVEECVAPAIVVEAAHAVRDIFAILGSPADAQVQLQVNVNGILYTVLTFAPEAGVSNSVLGSQLPPLSAMAQITVGVLSVGQACPGANLTVLIRL